MYKIQNKLITITTVLLVVFALINSVLAYAKISVPNDTSEFAGIKNAAISLYSILVFIFSTIQILCALFFYKIKRWAYFFSVLIVVLTIPVLGFGSITTLVFEFSPGNSISVTAEILPTLILLLLILNFKTFKKQ